ncbi:hypothetical protein J7413_20185, partial [Shimia sp. R10_1]|uniref:hypothetical protein n=1 Tax=Shimia sp. R10_1 TaxID=2821095 RepID=UPI001ADC4F08
QIGQDLSCAAANAQSLTRKALALGSAHQFLHQQHVVFQQNRRRVDLRCGLPKGQLSGVKRSLGRRSAL